MGVSEKTVRPAAAEGATKETATGGAATKEAAAEVATKEAAAEAATNMRQATTEATTKEAAAGAATNMRPAAGTAPMPGKAATGAATRECPAVESTAAPEQTAGATAAKEQTTAKEPAAPVRPQEDPLETNPLELIPQRPPMVLVDRFEGIDAEGVSTTGYTVVPAGLFVAGGRMSECGIIEHMAQSAAARIGWCCRAEGRPVPVGFIGAVSRLELHDLPRTGAHLRTRLRIVQEIGPLSLAEVRTEADGRPLAEGNLKIYLQS